MAGFTINTVTVSGNMTRDPEVRALPSGTSVTQLSVAVNERMKNSASGQWEDRVNFFDVTVWGGVGEAVARDTRKGSRVVVSGRLRWRSWEKDGQKRSAVDIVAESVVTFGEASGGSAGGRSAPSDVPIDTAGFGPTGGGNPAAADDDIPF